MKHTTKIIIAFLIAMPLLIIGFYVAISTMGSKRQWDTSLILTGETRTIQLPAAKAIRLNPLVHYTLEESGETTYTYFTYTSLGVVPSQSQKAELTLSGKLEKYMTYQLKGDTLSISFDFSREQCPEKFRKIRLLRVKSDSIVLALPTSVSYLNNQVQNLTNHIRKIEQPSFALGSSNTVIADGCSFDTLRIEEAERLRLNQGRAEHLYLDLDRVKNWTIQGDSFHIDTEYLSGSKQHRIYLPKNECRRVLWEPKKEGARIVVTLDSPGEVLTPEGK